MIGERGVVEDHAGTRVGVGEPDAVGRQQR